MQPDTVLTALTGIAEGFRKCLVKVDGSAATDVEALVRDPDWSKSNGWVARQSGIDLHPASTPTNGAVIEAEIATASSSLQIRRKDGSWITTTITEGMGDGVLFEDVQLVTTLKNAAGKPLAATYRRYWSLPDNGATEIVACRLVGFVEIAE